MQFKVYKRDIKPSHQGFYLYTDNWDDWFRYSTLYFLKYVNPLGETIDIGSVKIGQFNMKDDQRRPNILDEFDSLNDTFFSIGQNEDYYDNLNKLGETIREMVLIALNDIAYDLNLYNKVKEEDVTQTSLMRSLSEKILTGQFHRMAHGGVKLTSFSFGYSFPSLKNIATPASLTFDVQPESNPPTNIHAIIGRNGVGKTFLIKNLINTILIDNNPDSSGYFFDSQNQSKISANNLFTNTICVSFSAFDDLPSSNTKKNISLPYIFIGLNSDEEKNAVSRVQKLSNQFAKSLSMIISNKSKYNLWKKAMSILNYDYSFQESQISEIGFHKNQDSFLKEAADKFSRLSSGHKIILLIITQIVEVIAEKSLIILDEPETHLHPPLLSSFIRALSEILIEKNGIAIITTHSPIILQEVPSSCAWKMRRSKSKVSLERINIETFGANINSLIREVFGLEVDKSGFHQLLKDSMEKENYDMDTVINKFNNELGDEAKATLRILSVLKKRNDSL